MSLVPSFKKLNEEQKFVAKVEFLNVMRRITFCQPPYHVSFPTQSNLPGPSAHTSYTGTLPSVNIPSGTQHKICNGFQHQHNQCIQNPYSESRLAHSTLLLPTALPPLHICRPLMETVCHL